MEFLYEVLFRTDEICGLHFLVYTCLLGIQFDVQLSSPICVELLVILASTNVLFSSSVEVLGAKYSRSPKVCNEFD